MTTQPLTGRPSRERVIGQGLTWLAWWSIKWVAIAAGAVLLGLVIRETWTILLPIFLALILTSVLEPLSGLFERYTKFPPALAAAAALLTGIGVLVGSAVALAPSVVSQADDIAKDASSGLQELQEWVQRNELVTEAQIENGIQTAQERLTSSADAIAGGVLGGIGAVGSGVVTLVLTLLLTFFFLKDGRKFRPWVRSLTGPRAGPHVSEVLGRSWGTLGGFIRTQALVSLIDAVFIGIGLLVVGVPLAVPLAVLTFFGGFVPIVGAFVVGAIAVLVALVSVGWGGALVVLAIIVGVQQLEGNVLQPWLQSRVMQLHPVVVLLAVTLGSTLFGIVGAFLAVPVVAVFAVLLRYLNDVVTEQSAPVEPAESPEGEPHEAAYENTEETETGQLDPSEEGSAGHPGG
ncbi:AI-2E family transporter [Nocardioides caldifontis]|uniref:AI-2E family transporter n=1 Tax=Nocardioides caldifontis TaxID=2588938 RepID=UPI0013969FF6|nr:AI-2E family transporter [Nocardioides caldifontis]